MAAMMTGNVDGAIVNPPNNIILREKGYREMVGAKQMKNPAASCGVSDRTDQTIAASCGELDP